MHFHEAFMALMLHDGSIVAPFDRAQKSPADESFVFSKLLIGLSKPRTKIGILAGLDGWKTDDDNEHDTCLVVLDWKFRLAANANAGNLSMANCPSVRQLDGFPAGVVEVLPIGVGSLSDLDHA